MLLALFIARTSSPDAADGYARIAGTVAVGSPGTDGPAAGSRCGDVDGVGSAFVPTATAVSATDAADDPLVFAGSVRERDDGSLAFEIRVSVADTFRLGFRGETELDDGRVVEWEADVEPDEVAVEDPDDGVVDGVTYTITAVRCGETVS